MNYHLPPCAMLATPWCQREKPASACRLAPLTQKRKLTGEVFLCVCVCECVSLLTPSGYSCYPEPLPRLLRLAVNRVSSKRLSPPVCVEWSTADLKLTRHGETLHSKGSHEQACRGKTIEETARSQSGTKHSRERYHTTQMNGTSSPDGGIHPPHCTRVEPGETRSLTPLSANAHLRPGLPPRGHDPPRARFCGLHPHLYERRPLGANND